ncbi:MULTISPECIES: FtsW/RodA/SpoVE family cell cycle protein [Clostridia]|jgi:rod shape determining protein RodA|uniref:FtsW/RodA/SpoVE family cell cycle protein n=1 Tax=Clostridia TaxID=186801 RepID=UPI000E551F1A|nr:MULTISPECIES: FtsW/RodA/SpoVE family cell cycle protein [Clostridia]RHV70724.1 rod shape-determining protein RodA [Roseburia sp. OM02-15]
MFKQYKLKNYRFRLVAYVVLLCIIGVMVVGSAKPSVQNKQIIGIAGGLVVMVIVSLIDYGTILKFRRPIYLLAVVLLAVIFIPGVGDNTGGATRWIQVTSSFKFQPSEFCKILLIIFFAGFFMKYKDQLNTWKTILLSLILAGIPLVLIVKEPDLSTTIATTMIFITLLFVAGLSYKIVAGVLALGVPVGIIGVVLIMKQALPLKPYQYKRIMSWLQPSNPAYADDSYQQQNSIIAIGSGQLWGKGLNNSSITSLKNGDFISEPQTDFIFAVIGEELGFIGCLVVIILLLLIVFECILIAKNAKDLGGRLICCGMAALIGFQSFINICVTTGLMPNTGLPLPFVSYGLTSIMSLFIGLGMVLNVGLQARKYHGLGDID